MASHEKKAHIRNLNMPRIIDSPRGAISDIAVAMAAEISPAGRPTLLSPTTIALMIQAESRSVADNKSVSAFLPKYSRAYYYAHASQATHAALEEIIEISNLASSWESALADEGMICALAKSAAAQVVGLGSAGRKLTLLNPGMDISFRDGQMAVSMRRESDRRADAATRAVRENLFSLGRTGDAMASKEQLKVKGAITQFAKNAILNHADSDAGKYKRDGMFVATKGSNGRENFAHSLTQAAMTLFENIAGPGAGTAYPNSTRLLLAFNNLSRAVEQAMIVECESVVHSWASANGLGKALALSTSVWGSQTPIGELEFFSALGTSETASTILASRGNLGLFSLRAARGFGIVQIEEDLTGVVKGRMAALGLSDGAWRKLSLINPDDTREMLRTFSFGAPGGKAARDEDALRRFIQTINAATALNHNLDNVGRLCAMANEPGAEHDDFNRAFRGLFTNSLGSLTVRSIEEAEAYVAEGRAKERRMPFICQAFLTRTAKSGIEASSEELTLVNDFLKNSEQGVWQQIPEQPTWPQLLRLQEEWHRLVQEKTSGASFSWKSALEAHGNADDDSYLAVPLISGAELYSEGKEMRHCVSSYSSKCYEGGCRIFSIRRGAIRVGTLELAKGDAGWSVAQFKGRFNAKIEHPDAWAFAHEVASAYSKAWAAAAKEGGPIPNDDSLAQRGIAP